jgi:hypothetical protein
MFAGRHHSYNRQPYVDEDEETKHANACFAELLIAALIEDARKASVNVGTDDPVEPPHGALTFVGKKGEGIRAIPARHSKAYHAEFREGSAWWIVHNQRGAVVYSTAEDALRGASAAKLRARKS